MSPLRNQIVFELNRFSEEQLRNILFLIHQLPSAADEEDILTSAELEELRQSLAEYESGEVFTLEDVEWK